MGFKELIYPVHFTLRRVASACNKNVPFWKRGGGAGEAECCHMWLWVVRENSQGIQKREASSQSHGYFLLGWEAGLPWLIPPCSSKGFSVREEQVGFVAHPVQSIYLRSSCKWQKHMHWHDFIYCHVRCVTSRDMYGLPGLSQRPFQRDWPVCEKQMPHPVSDFCYEAMISGSWYVCNLLCCFLLWSMWSELWVALGGISKWEALHFAQSCIYSWLK